MQRQIIPIHSLKRFKGRVKHIRTDSGPEAIPGKKIKPIPFARNNVLSNPQLGQKFLLRGYKYFSKLVASGEQIFTKLSMIKRSNHIKHIKSFEFDAFLCDESCLRSLFYVFKRLGMTNSINLIVRRVDRMNESNLLEPFFGRMRRLKRIRIEFPSTDNVDTKAMQSLSKGLWKCYSIEALILDFIFLPLVPTQGFNCFSRHLQNFRNLKIFTNKKLLFPHKSFFQSERKKNKRAHFTNLESMSIYKGLKSGWMERTTTEIERTPEHILACSAYVNLRSFNFHFHRFQMTPGILIAFSTTVSNLPLLENVSLELVCCGLGDMEFGISTQIIQKWAQVKSYTYKLTQRPNVNEEQIISFAKSLSKMNNLEKFNVIFRGTTLVNAGAVTDELSQIKNMNLNLTKNSVHLYRENRKSLYFETI